MTIKISSHPATRILISIACCGVSGYFFSLFSNHMPIDKPLMPVALMGIMLIPSTLALGIISKLNDLKKAKGLNREEKRRLDEIVQKKVSRQILLLSLYIILAASIGVLFFAAPLPAAAPYIKQILAATGAAISFAITSSIFSVIDSNTIASFEARITNRSIERKAKAAILKKLDNK